jgi:excisionase family DNA binding protein
VELAQDIYTVEQVCDLLQIDKMTLYRRIKQGKIKTFRINGRNGKHRITRQALADFMRLQPVETEAR